MNQSLTLAFLIAAGIGLVVQNTLMVRITQTSSTILIAMLLNSLVGIVLFVSILWFKQGMAGFGELVSSVPRDTFSEEPERVKTNGVCCTP